LYPPAAPLVPLPLSLVRNGNMGKRGASASWSQKGEGIVNINPILDINLDVSTT
jgi:hypothetical protein